MGYQKPLASVWGCSRLRTLQKVLVTAYQTGGSGGAERLTENVTLNFAKVKVEYVTQSEKGGKGTPHAFGWDISANTKV